MEYEKLGQFYLGTVAKDRDGDGRPDFMLFDSILTTPSVWHDRQSNGSRTMLEEAAMMVFPPSLSIPERAICSYLFRPDCRGIRPGPESEAQPEDYGR